MNLSNAALHAPPARTRSGGATAWIMAVLAVLLVVVGSPARADVWTFVDPQGTTYFSTTRVDDSYELFLRGSDKIGRAHV